MAKIETTITTKLPLTSGKEATLTLEDGVVEIRTPASFKLPKVALDDLQAAVADLIAARTTQIVTHEGPNSDIPELTDNRPGDETEDVGIG